MTPHDDSIAVAHLIARLAGEESESHPRQRLVAWLKEHFHDHPEAIAAANCGWERSQNAKYNQFYYACKALDALYAGTDDIPSGGFQCHLYSWCHSLDPVIDPGSSFRSAARVGDAGARPAPTPAVCAEDQPSLPAWVGPRGHLSAPRTLFS